LEEIVPLTPLAGKCTKGKGGWSREVSKFKRRGRIGRTRKWKI